MVSLSFPSFASFLQSHGLTKSVFFPPEPSNPSLGSLVEQIEVEVEVLEESEVEEEGGQLVELRKEGGA